MKIGGSTARIAVVHPASAFVPRPSDYGIPEEVPEDVQTESSLWLWLKRKYPNVCLVYKPSMRKWFGARNFEDISLPEAFEHHFWIGRLEPGTQRSSAIVNLCRDTRDLAARLMEDYRHLTLKDLSDPAKQTTVAFMDEEFTMIGRPCVVSLVSFIRDSSVLPNMFNFVLGSAGSGKTYSILAAWLFLFLEFCSLANGRLMLVNGEEFSDAPALTLIRSLALAYHDSNTAEYYIARIQDAKDVEEVIKAMRKVVREDSGRRLYIVLDDGPDLTNQDVKFFRSMSTFAAVVLCGKWKQFEDRDSQRSHFINGGFTEDEVTSYLKFFNDDATITKESIKWQTGWVPGLVGKKSSGTKHRKALRKYIKEELSSEDAMSRFFRLISEGFVEVDESDEGIIPMLATGVFYLSCDGTVKCITESLLSYAASQFARLKGHADEQIRLWTGSVERDLCILSSKKKMKRPRPQ